MKIKGIILIIISCLVLNTNAQNEKETYWDNGNLKSLTNFNQEGQKSGYSEKYFESGERKEYGYYESGKKTGTWYEYYYDGTNKKRTSFYNGLIEETKSYYDNGRLMVSGRFDSNEKKHGRWMQYYNNWQQKLEGDYAHGKKQGQWKYYTETGELYMVENFNEGFRISKWEGSEKEYDYKVDSAVEAAADAVEEVKTVEGAVEVASEAVKVEVKSPTYYGNRLNGEWKFYTERGEVIEVGNYLNGRKDGKWTNYYENGLVKKVQLWKEDKLMEVVSYFDTSGKPLDKGTLKQGNGTVKEYDENDKLINTIEYTSGEKIDWNNWSLLNSLAWYIYEDETDIDALKMGIKMVKRSLEIERNYYNTDTYAALLFKTGKYKQALILAKEAINYAKKDGDDYSSSTKLIEQINEKMKK